MSAVSSPVRRILLWDDIVITAKWVVSLYGAVYLLFFNTTSLISFVALVLLAAVLANIAYVNAYAAYCSFKQQAYEHPNQYGRVPAVDHTQNPRAHARGVCCPS